MAAAASPAPALPAGLPGALPPPLFLRREQVVAFTIYAEGLLSDEWRKSVERRPAAAGRRHEPGAAPAQYVVVDSAWSDQPFLERHRQVVGSPAGHARRASSW